MWADKNKSQESIDSMRVEKGDRSNLAGQETNQEMLTLDITYPRMAPLDENFRLQIEAKIREAVASADKRLLNSELDHVQCKYERC